jgi:hypothetical protein
MVGLKSEAGGSPVLSRNCNALRERSQVACLCHIFKPRGSGTEETAQKP